MELTLSGILVWFMTGGCVIAISWLAEQFDWFAALSTAKKQLIQWGGSIVLGLGAWAVLKFVPPETLTMLEDPFKDRCGKLRSDLPKPGIPQLGAYERDPQGRRPIYDQEFESEAACGR